LFYQLISISVCLLIWNITKYDTYQLETQKKTLEVWNQTVKYISLFFHCLFSVFDVSNSNKKFIILFYIFLHRFFFPYVLCFVIVVRSWIWFWRWVTVKRESCQTMFFVSVFLLQNLSGTLFWLKVVFPRTCKLIGCVFFGNKDSEFGSLANKGWNHGFCF